MAESTSHPDEIAAVVSYIPQLDEDDQDEMAPGEFIFVLDWSGSMSGSGIQKATEALTLFLNSLPSGSYFNILSFGSHHSYMFDKSKEYTKQTLSTAIEQIKTFGGDMGGTDLLRPLQDLLPQHKVKSELPWNVFILTDGEIDDPKSTCQYISQFSHDTWIHTFGFGSGVDWYLVKEMAKQGKGTYAILEDTSSLNVNTNVIKALKHSTVPAFTNLKADWNMDVSHQVPWAPFIETYFANELFILTAILKKSTVTEDSRVIIEMFETLTGKQSKQELNMNHVTWVTSDEIFKVVAKRDLEHLSLEEKKNASVKSQIIELSKKY